MYLHDMRRMVELVCALKSSATTKIAENVVEAIHRALAPGDRMIISRVGKRTRANTTTDKAS
jgi:hypothetical protein